MTLAGQILPKSEICGPKAVDCAVGQLDLYLPAKHTHPASAGCGVKIGELSGLVDLDRTIRAGLESFQHGVVHLQLFNQALAVTASVHPKNAHSQVPLLMVDR